MVRPPPQGWLSARRRAERASRTMVATASPVGEKACNCARRKMPGTLVVRACSGARRTARVVVRREDGGPANANAEGREVGDYLRSRRRTDLFVALPRTSGTVQAQPERPSTEESLYYVNTTGISPVSIGLVQRLMSTATGAAMLAAKVAIQLDRQFKCRYWCYVL